MCFDFIIMKLNQSHISITNNDLFRCPMFFLSPPYFIMATITAFVSFVPLTLPLENQGYMNVFKDFFEVQANKPNKNHACGAKDVFYGL